MNDYIVRGIAAGGQIRVFAATTRNVVETARQHHEMSPIATVALGRLLTGGAMMVTMMKNDSDVVTIQIKGHSYHFHRTTCVPSLLQTLRLHTSVLEIIYFVDMISGILIDSKAIS